MPYFGDKYLTEVRPVLLDWLSYNNGQSVTDLVLSLANRAQKNLWAKKPWADLVKDHAFALNSTNSEVLPADFGRVIDMWADFTGLGVPSYWYYDADNYLQGYKIRDSFDKSTGHSWTITFHYPQTAVNMRYQAVLADFSGTGDEYSLFPANLLILEAQKIHLLEKGDTKGWQAVSAQFEEIFKDYCNCHQWVNRDTLPRINDRLGNEIMLDGYSLDGDNSTRPYGLSNAFIL